MLRNYQNFILMLLATFIIPIVSACSNNEETSNKGSTDSDVFKWDFNLHVGLDEGTGVWMTQFADSVRERTEGKLDITPRPPGELPYSAEDSVRITSDRSVEMADATIAYIAGDVEAAILPTWPFLASKDTETFMKAVETIRPFADEELAEYGIETLFWLSDPPQYLWGVGEPVKTLDDLKGLKIRTFSPEQQTLMSELGATPVSMVMSEVPSAIQRGVVDAALTGPVGAYESKWGDIIDWGYTMPFAGSGAFMLVNSEALNELPEDIKEILVEEAEKWEQIGNEEVEKWAQESVRKIQEEYGVEINDGLEEDIKKAEKIMENHWYQWAEESDLTKELEAILEAIK